MAKVAGLKECAELLARTKGIPKNQAEDIMRSCIEVIASKCVEGGVSFKGVFTIKKDVRKGRTGSINGHSYTTEDKNILKISVGKDLDSELNK